MERKFQAFLRKLTLLCILWYKAKYEAERNRLRDDMRIDGQKFDVLQRAWSKPIKMLLVGKE